MNKRTFEFTHEEVELIEKALDYVWNQKLQLISDKSLLITPEIREKLLESANKFGDLSSEISEGNKDV